MNIRQYEKTFDNIIQGYAVKQGILTDLGNNTFALKDYLIKQCDDKTYDIMLKNKKIYNTFLKASAIVVAKYLARNAIAIATKTLEIDKEFEKLYWDVQYYKRIIKSNREQTLRHSTINRCELAELQASAKKQEIDKLLFDN